MAEVVEINDIDQLEHYYLYWNSLLSQTPGATLFQSLDWLKAYWRRFGDGQRLRVLVVYSNGSPIGIVPLTVISERTRLGQVRVLTYPLHDWAMYYGPIGPNPTATLTAAMRHIRNTARDWDMVDLRWVNRNGHDHGRTQQAMQAAGLNAHESVWKETAVIDCDGTWDEYFAGRSSGLRSNIRRYEKRVHNLGDVQFERYRPQGSAHGDGDPRWDLYDAVVDVARRSWQGSSTDGTTLSHDSVRAFFRETHELAARTGALDLNVIKLDGRPIAFGYNYHMNGYVYGMRIGYDPQFSKTGVGKVLYAKTFRDSFERGDRVFDLGPGSMEIKLEWMTRTAHCHRYTHYPLAAPRTQLLRMKHWWNNRHSADKAGAKKIAV